MCVLFHKGVINRVGSIFNVFVVVVINNLLYNFTQLQVHFFLNLFKPKERTWQGRGVGGMKNGH